MCSPQSAAIEYFLARLDRPTPPIGLVRLASQYNKSNGSMAGQPGPGLEPVFHGVCVQCISGLLLGRHQYHRFPNRPLPFPNLPPRGSNCPLVHISNRSPEAGPAPSPPREAPAHLASNPKSTVTRVLSAFQVCSFPMVCFLLSVREGQNLSRGGGGGALLSCTRRPIPGCQSPDVRGHPPTTAPGQKWTDEVIRVEHAPAPPPRRSPTPSSSSQMPRGSLAPALWAPAVLRGRPPPEGAARGGPSSATERHQTATDGTPVSPAPSADLALGRVATPTGRTCHSSTRTKDP